MVEQVQGTPQSSVVADIASRDASPTIPISEVAQDHACQYGKHIVIEGVESIPYFPREQEVCRLAPVASGTQAVGRHSRLNSLVKVIGSRSESLSYYTHSQHTG